MTFDGKPFKLIDKNDGIDIVIGGKGKRNAYKVWEEITESDNKIKYVSMEILSKDIIYNTLFDFDDLDKIKSHKRTWFLVQGGYVARDEPYQYLHHLITDFTGTGRGFQHESIDHINRNKLDNRKCNLRRATPVQQVENSTGVIKDTKRNRSKSACKLPEEIKSLPQYVEYRKETSKEYFALTNHGTFGKNLKINGKIFAKNFIKSKQGLTTTISEKLNEIIEKIKILDEIYEIYLQTKDPNITFQESEYLNEILGEIKKSTLRRVKTINVGSGEEKEYNSVADMVKSTGCSEHTIRRLIANGKHSEKYGFFIREI